MIEKMADQKFTIKVQYEYTEANVDTEEDEYWHSMMNCPKVRLRVFAITTTVFV